MRFKYAQELKALPVGEHFDDTLKGLSLIVRASGSKSFTFVYRYDRRQKRWTLGRFDKNMTLKEARDLVKFRSVDPVGDKKRKQKTLDNSQSETFGQLAKLYVEQEASQVQRFWHQTKSALRHPRFEALNGRAIAAIRQSEISNLLSETTRSNGSYNQIRALLHTVFRFAETQELIVKNPVTNIKTRSALPRDRVLNDEEIRSVWRVPIFRLILLTVQRPTNCYQIRRSEIDSGLWTIPASGFKLKRPHVTPLVKTAVDTLEELPNRGDKYFTRDDCLGLIAVLDDLEIKQARPKDLQRTSRSRLAMIGILPDTAARIQGHSLGSVRGTYDRYDYLEEKKTSLLALESELLRIVNDE